MGFNFSFFGKQEVRRFHYIPRFYDPETEERRKKYGDFTKPKEEGYTPGKYIRTQREARDASRGENNAMAGMVRLLLIAVVLGFAMLIFLPRFVRFAERAQEEKLGHVTTDVERVRVDESEDELTITLYEKHGDIDFTEFESLTPEIINEIEEWNREHPTLNIYDDDVEIVDYKRVDK